MHLSQPLYCDLGVRCHFDCRYVVCCGQTRGAKCFSRYVVLVLTVERTADGAQREQRQLLGQVR